MASSGRLFALAAVQPFGASRFLFTDAAGAVDDSAVVTNGQLLIGATGSAPVVAAISQASANQVIVTNAPGQITLSLPQNIDTAAIVQFGGVQATGQSWINSQLAVGANGVVSTAVLSIGGGLAVTDNGASQYGLWGNPVFEHAGGLTAATVLYAGGSISAGNTATVWYAGYLAAPLLGAGATVATLYGLYIDSMTVGGSQNYAIYTNSGKVRFGGIVNIDSLRCGIGLGATAGRLLNIGGYADDPGFADQDSYGIFMQPMRNGTVGDATHGVVGIEVQPAFDVAGVHGRSVGILLRTPLLLLGTVTSAYGIYIDAITTGTTDNYAIYTNAGLVRFGGAVTVASGGVAVTGLTTLTGTATAGGVGLLTATPGAHTAVVGEVLDYSFAAHTMTITAGYATQRFVLFAQPVISAATALTVTTAATVTIAGAPTTAGLGPAAITNPYAFWVQTGKTQLDGALTVSTGGITVTGDSTITGTLGGITTLTATTLAGTLSTAAQTAITSVGTLVGLVIADNGVIKPASSSTQTLTVAGDNDNGGSQVMLYGTTHASRPGGMDLALDNVANAKLSVIERGSGSVFLTVLGTSGNVGIGTTTPYTVLDIGVAANTFTGYHLHIGNDTRVLMCCSSASATAANGSLVLFDRYRGTHALPTALSAGDLIAQLLFYGFTDARKEAAIIKVEADTGWGATGNDSPAKISFWTTPDGTAAALERLTINNAGNVGIGASSPSTALEIAGDDKTALLHAANANVLARMRVTASSAFVDISDSGVGANAATNYYSGGSALWTTGLTDTVSPYSQWHLIEYVAGVATPRITAQIGGDVGIGVSAPTAALHLKAGTATASTAPLKFSSGALLTTPEAGAVEFVTDAYYGTITTGAARKTFAFLESPSFTTPSLGAASATSLSVPTLNTIRVRALITTAIKTVATSILTIAETTLALVQGQDGDDYTRNFGDVIIADLSSLSVTVLATASAGGAHARTYTVSGTDVKVAFAAYGGTVGYTVRVQGFGS